MQNFYSTAADKSFAVGLWLIQNTACDTPELPSSWKQSRAEQIRQYYQDTTIDTVIPPISSLDRLDTLLAKHFFYLSVSEKHGPDIITSATASPNPTQNGVTITFGTAQDAYVKIEVFDVMGRVPGSGDRVPGTGGPGFEEFLTAGNHSLPISMSSLPSGTYYARISTSFGESRTVKLVKE